MRRFTLTATEFALLRVLATTRGTVSYRTLARKVWGARRGDERLTAARPHGEPARQARPRRRTSVIRTDIGLGYRFVGHEGTAAQASQRRRSVITASVCTESVREAAVSVYGLYATEAMMTPMDIVAVLLGLVMFAVLFALIYGIERI